MSASLQRALQDDWFWWARPSQWPPEGDWRTWVCLGGRGAGKTRAGAEWVSALARSGRAGRIALIAPTFHDVREVMIDGVSGVRSLGGERPVHEQTRRRLVWRNGAQATCFSAEDPESLRGPQFDAAWCDELCFWSYPERTLATLAHAMRVGAKPRTMVTTTPRPIPALKRLLAARDTVTTRSSTWENERNLSADFIEALREGFVGDACQRQELLGELIEEVEGALWTRGLIERSRWPLDGPYDRIVVGVDPPARGGVCGIVGVAACGEGASRRAVVLADASIKGAEPVEWAKRVAALARSLGAHAIVAEGNNGGEMVRTVLGMVGCAAPIQLVHARSSKRDRALPISVLYAQNRVTHAGAFPELEDEMCGFGGEGFNDSPDRLDALVWALDDLMQGPAGPRIRQF